MVWMVAEASCASTTGSAEAGSSPLLLGDPETRRERLVEFDKSFQHHGADLRIGDRFRGRRHHGKTAARAGVAGEINVQRHREDALQPFFDRQFGAENVGHRRAGVGAVALVTLDVEFALVAERAVQARPVHAGGGREVVERGRGEAVLAEQVERLRQRHLRLIRARAAAAFRFGGGRAPVSCFFVPFRKLFLDAVYIMRNSIKIKTSRPTTNPHPEERPVVGRVSKDGQQPPWFETRASARSSP